MEAITIVQGLEKAPEAREIREEIFLREQGFSTEFDEEDASAWHLLLKEGENSVATGRLFPKKGEEGVFIIGRVAVVKKARGQHYGQKVVQALEEKAQALGGRKIELGAQAHAQTFYEQLGYRPCGALFYDEHCPHIPMEKSLTK